MKHTISVLVENKFGVLARISGLFSARGFNISSLAVGETEDPSVSRMTIGVEGDDKTLEQIKKLDAGSKFRKSFAGTEVPTLKEVFAFMKGKINAYVDFKAGSPEKFAAILKEYDMVEHSVVYSSLEQAAQLTKINSAIKVMPGIDETKLLAPLQKQYDLKAVETNIASLTKEYVEEAHRLGMVVFCDVLGFTDSKQSIKKAAGLGVDVIQTDNADIAIKYIKNMNMKKN